jgi:hypothetical protein
LNVLLQIQQSIANHVVFTKEEHMRPFNDFVKSNFDAARRYDNIMISYLSENTLICIGCFHLILITLAGVDKSCSFDLCVVGFSWTSHQTALPVTPSTTACPSSVMATFWPCTGCCGTTRKR